MLFFHPSSFVPHVQRCSFFLPHVAPSPCTLFSFLRKHCSFFFVMVLHLHHFLSLCLLTLPSLSVSCCHEEAVRFFPPLTAANTTPPLLPSHPPLLSPSTPFAFVTFCIITKSLLVSSHLILSLPLVSPISLSLSLISRPSPNCLVCCLRRRVEETLLNKDGDSRCTQRVFLKGRKTKSRLQCFPLHQLSLSLSVSLLKEGRKRR